MSPFIYFLIAYVLDMKPTDAPITTPAINPIKPPSGPKREPTNVNRHPPVEAPIDDQRIF